MALNVTNCLSSEERFFEALIKEFKDCNENLYSPKTKKAKNCKIFSLENVDLMLRRRKYLSDFWMFIEDITSSFKFIQKYFSKRTMLHRLSLDCQEQFNGIMDEFMKNRGYCCGTWHTRKSRKIQCSGDSKCNVKINSKYYTFDLYTFCEKCFKKLPSTDIMLNENITVNKADFNTCILNKEESEDFVSCTNCKKMFHERCVLHIKQSDIPFYCQKCRIREPALKKINISSEQISKTECDIYIENFLKEHNVPNCNDIVVRLVSNVPTNLYTKPVIAKYHNKNYGNEINYNNCVIFVFLKLSDGTEICFFGVYFQLYGNSKCPEPNKNSAYLSYIDSVKLCNIKERTKTYQCILLGLFSYLKVKNFHKIFIWSCPPKRNVDYIFHQKPADMKIPTKNRLIDWYKTLMKLAVDKLIIESFEGVKSFAERQNWRDINNIPYFESDLWPARLECAISTAEKQSKKSPENLDVMDKILSLMEFQINGFDQQYFVLHLQGTSSLNFISPTFPEIVPCKWINSRNNLVDMFFEHCLEYSNDRLAKFSTIILLYRIILDLRICLHCFRSSKQGITTSLMCKNCSGSYSIDKIDRSLWKLEKKDIVNQDSNNFFRLSVPITPLLEKREQNFNVTKPCLKTKYKEERDEFDYAMPTKKRKFVDQSASSEMFQKQFTPMETRSKKYSYKKFRKFFI
ncbi:histone acetyltransferase p300-like [Chironomus tepperi]|uniref:histone acetyltransferase p300-like n=1 Tax=Chironomus tepperi TaxID=113505 RepID=UPI00391F1A40